MLNRRQFLVRTLQGTSLLAIGSVVPRFLANTALAAQPGKDTVLVVIEMAGGNDGLNTVIPYADELYHKYRPTLRQTKDQVLRVNDQIGLHPAMRPLDAMLQSNQLAVVQGVGYPNPDRSHFESMDVWQMGDPERKVGSGWIARGGPELLDNGGSLPLIHIGANRLPLALQGAPGGVVSINNQKAYRLDLGRGDANEQKERRGLLEELAKPKEEEDPTDLLQFVQRRQVQTYTTLDRLQDILKPDENPQQGMADTSLGQKMNLIAKLINKGFGTRVFYVMIDGFDTHSGQAEDHARLLGELSGAINSLFSLLKESGHDKRVVTMTFSEFGRRVQENGSKGTDHGAASCLFVAGPAVKGGPVGAHPSLSDLDEGDLKHQLDFRRVYATLLDQWMGCDSRTVLGAKFEHLDMLKARA
jgi:uncharacterized protein (DUF1501 family)